MEWRIFEGRRMVFTYGSRFRTACDISAAGGFGKLIKQDSGVRDRIGCANATESTSPAVEQVFERGHMRKRSNTGEILVTFFDDGHWASYADTFKTGDPEPTQRAPPAVRRSFKPSASAPPTCTSWVPTWCASYQSNGFVRSLRLSRES
jgi:hypothetical protein